MKVQKFNLLRCPHAKVADFIHGGHVRAGNQTYVDFVVCDQPCTHLTTVARGIGIPCCQRHFEELTGMKFEAAEEA